MAEWLNGRSGIPSGDSSHSAIQPFSYSFGLSAIQRLSHFCLAFALAACYRSPGTLQVSIVPADVATPAYVHVTGLSSDEIASLRGATLDEAAWQQILRVGVEGLDGPPIAGRYVITAGTLQFHPRFPFDPGRAYDVRFDPSKLPAPRAAAVLQRSFTMPAAPAAAPTTVTAIAPTGGAWPENLLRFYIHFSAPMSRTSALGFVRLEDDRGRTVQDAFLPLDVDLWNADRTRYTVFFDPGRVKRGILPNVELGRALDAGRRYAIVVDAGWRDASGQPLASAHRYEFTAGPAVERAIAVGDWKIVPPASGTRQPLIVTFPWALDDALLHRAIGVARADGGAIAGKPAIGDSERRWEFVPDEAWRPGRHQLVVLSVLEDPAGNRVGRAFEIEMLSQPRPAAPEQVTVAFAIN